MGRGDNPSEDVWGLFLLLDADGNGAVDLDEFVNGCMQLRGPAKSYLPLADVCGKKMEFHHGNREWDHVLLLREF